MTGAEIHNYRIVAKIGEGGMATVYKAVHKTLPGMVRAVKMMHPVLSMDAGIKTKFINEASAMAALDHPNIVKIFDYLEQDGNLFLVMEYVDGINLDEMIKSRTGPIPEDRAKKIFSKILDAIGYAHSKGIVHRDIKPSNIIIAANDEPKIIDFGIVKILEDDHNPGKTKTGTKVGTPLYMSPEQILAKGVDLRTDIYALGVTLFQVITGRPPYPNSLSEYEIQTQIINERLPRIKELYPSASDAMQGVIDKATAKKKEDRYQNCEQFKKGLDQQQVLQEQNVQQSRRKEKRSTGIDVVFSLIGIAIVVGVLFISRSNNTPDVVMADSAATLAVPAPAPAPAPADTMIPAANNHGDENEFNTTTIRNIISNYYSLSCSQHYNNGLADYLDVKIEKFYNMDYPQLDEIYKNRTKYCERWPDRTVTIDWASLNYNANNGIMYVSFDQKYRIRRYDSDHFLYFNIHTLIKFNKLYKMVYINDEKTEKIN